MHDHPAVLRGIRYLIESQRDDGTWDEPEFTGTGFPQVFYLRYHWYPIYFPLMALAQWTQGHGRQWAHRFAVPRYDGRRLTRRRSARKQTSIFDQEFTMRFPLSLTRTMASYLLRKKLAGENKFPLVLMLEPLHACNLTCTGCGRIREYVEHDQGQAHSRRMPGQRR